MKKVVYDDLAAYLNDICVYYNSAVACDDVDSVSLNSFLIRGFCMALDSLGVSYRFTGNEFYDTFTLDGKKYVVSD